MADPRAMRHAPSQTERPVTLTGLAGRADLHVHTTHSDGTFSPCQVVVAAARVGLAAVAITDHDTISAIAPARVEATRWPVELIPAVEITSSFAGRELHLLGYHIREDHPALVAALDRLKAARAERFKAITLHLARSGLHIDLESIRRAHPRASLGRRLIAEYLVRTQQVPDVRTAFVLHLSDQTLASLPKPRLDSAHAIALVRAAGGVASWAHPNFDLRLKTLESLVDQGLQAVEVDGPGFTKKLTLRLRDWAGTLDLIPTAGTDFHAADRPGRWIGAISTPADEFARLRAAASQSRQTAANEQLATSEHALAGPGPAVESVT